ncbi:MAG: hypothetical protein IT204_15035 [Fimbriimonadaceae bacterium]|nr:hypothetical protein [Fimbriimonadaceae bacterium]
MKQAESSNATTAPWTWQQACAWATLGSAALALAQWQGPAGRSIWLVPVVAAGVATRATRRQTGCCWLLLCLGATITGGWQVAPGSTRLAWSLALALDLAAFLALGRWLAARGNALVVAAGLAAGRVLLERLWQLTPLGEGFSWGAYRLDAALLAQALHIGGVAAVSFLVTFVGTAVGVLILDPQRRAALRVVASAMALLAATVAAGLDRLDRGSSENLQVAAVAAHDDRVPRLAALTAAVVTDGSRVVVWPAAAVPVAAQPDSTPGAVGVVARELGSWLVTGLHAVGRRQMLIAAPSGRHVDSGSLPHGALLGPPQASFGRLGALEDAALWSAGPARAAAALGCTVLAIPADSTPNHERLAWLARLRAAENGMVVVRCARDGGSLVVDPFGSLVAAADRGGARDQVLSTTVPIVRGGLLLATERRLAGWLAAVLLAVLAFAPPRWRLPYHPLLD